MNKPLISRTKLRAEIRQQRSLLTDDFQQHAAQSLVEQLTDHCILKTAKNIAIYLANDSELDPVLLITWCWQQNINTYLPVIHPFNKGQLLFLHYHKSSKMQLNRYGILEPKLNVNDVLPTSKLDVIFTPLVAFSKSGQRLGMGGGYYDRTLATWFAQTKNAQQSTKKSSTVKNIIVKPYPIGLAHDCQRVDNIPTEHWDIPLPEIITPTQKIKF